MTDADDVPWPHAIPDFFQTFLRRHFINARQLEACFDDDLSCQELVTSGFPDMNPEDIANIVGALLVWKQDSQRAFKRARSSVVQTVLSGIPLSSVDSGRLQSEYKQITSSSAMILLEGHAKRRHQLYKGGPADIRSQRFDRERKKFALLLGNCIKEAGLPIVQQIALFDDPHEAWLRVFATRRANTLKARYKTWKPFRDWLEQHRGRVYPLGTKDAVDYLQFRVNEGCGKTVPESLSCAIHLIEQVGKVPEVDRISKDPVWDSFVKSWAAEIAEVSEPKKVAPMYTVAMCISLECLVDDIGYPLYARALAWVVLIMLWGAMRCDDVQAINPSRILLSGLGLRLYLSRTKTTGPDKPQKEVQAFVHRQTSLTGIDWIGVGYALWTSEPFSYRRDYLVMEATAHWGGVRRKFLTPSGLASNIKQLLGMLGTPRFSAGAWSVINTTLLLPDSLEDFFSGHSPRNWLTSIAAIVGFPKEQRAYLGRWMIGMTASEEYVRTARQIVTKIQIEVNRVITTGRPCEYIEDETVEALCHEAASRGANPMRIRKRHTVMNKFTGKVCLGSMYPTLVLDDEGPAIIDDTPDERQLERLASKHTEQCSAVTEPKFFITVSRRTSFRRLHLSGCFVKAAHCAEVRFADEVNVEEFDTICRACKKKMCEQSGKEAAADSSTSTASSSSTEAEDPELEV